MIADADSEPVRATLQAPEAERWMMWVAPPQLVSLVGWCLNISGKRVQ